MTILQIDREAAANVRLMFEPPATKEYGESVAGAIREGRVDQLSLVQAFAAHREQAVASLATVLEDCILQLEYMDSRFPTGSTPAIIARARLALAKANGDA